MDPVEDYDRQWTGLWFSAGNPVSSTNNWITHIFEFGITLFRNWLGTTSLSSKKKKIKYALQNSK
jgi:hypothetical protein